jgi:hypothetical protein
MLAMAASAGCSSAPSATRRDGRYSPDGATGRAGDRSRRDSGIHRAVRRPAGWLAQRRGSLVCLAASAARAYEAELTQAVFGHVDGLRRAFLGAFEHARVAGKLAAGRDPEALADYRIGAMIGLMTMARSPIAAASLQHLVLGVLDHFDHLTAEESGK